MGVGLLKTGSIDNTQLHDQIFKVNLLQSA